MDKSCHQTWQDMTLLIIRLSVAALFLGMAWNKFTNWSGTMDFLIGSGTGIGLPAWLVTIYAYLLPFVEAFIGLSFLIGWCSKISGAVLFLTVFSFWIVLSKNPNHPSLLLDSHYYLMLIGLTVFSFGMGKYRLLNCNWKCCRE